MPCEVLARMSWKPVSGSWQVAHDTSRLPLTRVSKKSSLPSAAAAGSSANRFDGAGGTGAGHAPVRATIASRSRAVNGPPPPSHPTAPATHAATAAAQAAAGAIGIGDARIGDSESEEEHQRGRRNVVRDLHAAEQLVVVQVLGLEDGEALELDAHAAGHAEQIDDIEELVARPVVGVAPVGASQEPQPV